MKNLRQINTFVPLDLYERIKRHAANQSPVGKPVNMSAFIRQVLVEHLDKQEEAKTL